MLKITITGDRNEGKTLLSQWIEDVLDDKDIHTTFKYGVEDVISITDSKQVRERC